ncbi:MAG TPA: MgtC/SapB family protein [Rhodocyclaceae bacterium]|jgi:uncharacterized membrane protein YhiD involved in acid resistance
MDSVVNGHLISFLTSLAIGLLIGVERERAGASIEVRTFALTAVLGAISALVGQWQPRDVRRPRRIVLHTPTERQIGVTLHRIFQVQWCKD